MTLLQWLILWNMSLCLFNAFLSITLTGKVGKFFGTVGWVVAFLAWIVVAVVEWSV